MAKNNLTDLYHIYDILEKEFVQFSTTVADCEFQQEAYHSFAKGAGRLAGAKRTLIFLNIIKNLPKSEKCLKFSCVADWTEGEEKGKDKSARFNKWCFYFYTESNHTESDRIETMKKDFIKAAARIEELMDFNGRALDVDDILRFKHNNMKGIVVLLNYDSDKNNSINNEFRIKTADLFVKQAAPIVANHANSFALKISLKISEKDLKEPEQALQWAAQCLQEHITCDAVLIYTEKERELTVSAASPENKELLDFSAEKKSLTKKIYDEQKDPINIIDTNDEKDTNATKLNNDILKQLAKACKKEKVRSWLCYPIKSQGRCIGVIKLLTFETGIYLLPCHIHIVQAVADRTGIEIQRIIEIRRMKELRNIVYSLAEQTSSEIAKNMGNELRSLFEEFISSECKVLVLTVAGSDLQYEIFSVSDNVERHLKNEIKKNFPQLSKEVLTDKVYGIPCIESPVNAPSSEEELLGSVFVISNSLKDNDTAIVKEACREIAVLLDYEKRKHDLVRIMGLFRHAVIGPVQGLLAAGKTICLSAENDDSFGKKEKIKELKSNIEGEAEKIRLWRENQRLYMSEEVKLKKRYQKVEPVIKGCVHRFKSYFKEERNIELSFKAKLNQSLKFEFDSEAIDLVLSNLLDNAFKYAFFNTEVDIGITISRKPVLTGKLKTFVEIWVEDTGHPVKEEIEKTIYKEGERIKWNDPIRVITGSGFGLSMAKRIVDAHGGMISHTSTPATAYSRTGITPHFVRFTVSLPVIMEGKND